MSAKIIRDLVRGYRQEYHVYPFEFFESRIKEEMVRADLSRSGFAYIEIIFGSLLQSNTDDDAARSIWKLILEVISQVVRGSDVKGFLENDKGLGLMLLDSNMQAVHRLRHRILARIREEGLSAHIREDSADLFLQGFVYPDRRDLDQLEEDGSSLDP